MGGHMNTAEHEQIAASVVKALDVEGLGRKARGIREVVMLVAGGVLFVSAVTVGLVGLQAKPSTPDVESMIETTAVPIIDRVKRVEAASEDLAQVREDVDRIENVQDYLIEQSSWQGDILEHMAGRNLPDRLKKPESLKSKERELLRQ